VKPRVPKVARKPGLDLAGNVKSGSNAAGRSEAVNNINALRWGRLLRPSPKPRRVRQAQGLRVARLVEPGWRGASRALGG